jgi:hypothetical protein
VLPTADSVTYQGPRRGTMQRTQNVQFGASELVPDFGMQCLPETRVDGL